MTTKPLRLTVKAVRSALQEMGFTLTKDSGGDWRVRERGAKGDAATYYTNDLLDAFWTAQRMRKAKVSEPELDVPHDPKAAAVSNLPSFADLTKEDSIGYRDDPRRPKLTARVVNRHLAAAHIRGEIRQGRGYVYFVGDDFDHCYSTSVPVCWLNDMGLRRWLAEARDILVNGR